MASASPVRVAAWRHRPMGDRAPGPLRPVSSARQTGHQRVSVLRVRKPPKSAGFRETKGGGAPHLHRACRIRNESFGQSSIKQEATDALESRGSPLPSAGSRRASKRHADRRLPCGESALSRSVWLCCAIGALRRSAPPLKFLSHPKCKKRRRRDKRISRSRHMFARPRFASRPTNRRPESHAHGVIR